MQTIHTLQRRPTSEFEPLASPIEHRDCRYTQGSRQIRNCAVSLYKCETLEGVTSIHDVVRNQQVRVSQFDGKR